MIGIATVTVLSNRTKRESPKYTKLGAKILPNGNKDFSHLEMIFMPNGEVQIFDKERNVYV